VSVQKKFAEVYKTKGITLKLKEDEEEDDEDEDEEEEDEVDDDLDHDELDALVMKLEALKIST